MKSEVKGRFYPCSDLEIEAYLCGELEGAGRDRVECMLGQDEPLRRYVTERREAQRAFAERHPRRARGDECAQRGAARERSRGLMIGIPAVSVVALAAAVGLLWTKPVRRSGRASDPVGVEPVIQSDRVRVKGDGLSAMLHVKRGDEVFQHEAHKPLRAGDRVRLRVEAARGGYLTVLARDERGRVSVYYHGLAISAGRFLVPDSLLLDADFGPERWLVVVADEPRAPDVYVAGWRKGKLPPARYTTLELSRSTR